VSEKQISVTLTQQHDYRFDIRFDDTMPVLTSDEPAPLGTGLGKSNPKLPSLASILAMYLPPTLKSLVAAGHCQSSLAKFQ
jgi:hypothetical protein